jgi:ATP dependent DNA ligase C terminal region
MADQAERVILEAEDQVSPVVDKANAGLDSFEKKAESSHSKVIRISDQTRSSVQRLIASLEKQAETYGKSGVERLITQRDQLLQRYNREPQAIDAITRSYEKMIAAEEKVAREALAVKAAKEAEEALQKQSESIKAFGERVGQFMENPLQGAKGAISSVLTALGPFGIAVASGAAVLGTIAMSAFEAAKSLGEYGTRVKDAELRTGLTAKEVGQFGFAARAVGQDISIVERLMRGLSQAANDNSNEGEKARSTMRAMGIDFHTATGEMKPTSEILVEISEGLNKLPEGFRRDAAAMDLFKKVGVEAIPFMTELNENLRVAHEQGFGPTEEDIRRFSEYQREVTRSGFTPASRDQLFKQFRALTVETCPFANLPEAKSGRWGVGLTAEKMKECRWMTPTLVGQFEFVEWTPDGHLRHSRFMGLIEADARKVVREL